MTTILFKTASIHAERAEFCTNGQIRLYGVHIQFLPGAPVPDLLDIAPPASSVPLPEIKDDEAPDGEHEVTINGDDEGDDTPSLVPAPNDDDGDDEGDDTPSLVPAPNGNDEDDIYGEEDDAYDNDVEMTDVDDSSGTAEDDTLSGKFYFYF